MTNEEKDAFFRGYYAAIGKVAERRNLFARAIIRVGDESVGEIREDQCPFCMITAGEHNKNCVVLVAKEYDDDDA